MAGWSYSRARELGEPVGVVISVCAAKHAATWRRAAPNILRFIEARSYRVIVPDDDVRLFRRLTPAGIDVAAESGFVAGIAPALRAALPPATDRFGWYLQQFIKLSALIEADCATALVWDADTIPLRPLRFEDEAGRLLYYTSDERHGPYFDAIQRLLGLSSIHPGSFVAQCFPMRNTWMRSFVAAVEERGGRRWYEEIIAATDFDGSLSGFSEYETLGTYLMHTHADGIRFNTNPWLRRGAAAVGGIGAFDTVAEAWLASRFDYVAFEAWDRVPPRRALDGVQRRARRLLRGNPPFA